MDTVVEVRVIEEEVVVAAVFKEVGIKVETHGIKTRKHSGAGEVDARVLL